MYSLERLGKAVCIRMGDEICLKDSLLPLFSFSLLEQGSESEKVSSVEKKSETSMFPTPQL